MCGALPIFANHFFAVFYFDFSSRDMDAHGAVAYVDIEAQDGGYDLFSWYIFVTNRAFIALWLVCWIVFARYRSVRLLHFGEAVAAEAADKESQPPAPAGKGRGEKGRSCGDTQPVRESNLQQLVSSG